MKSIYTRLFLLIALIAGLAAQRTEAQVGIGTTTPDAQAMLDITSTTKGLLLPRLTAAQQATLAATLTAAQTGMLITDATTGKPAIWAGAAWKDVTGVTITATAPLAVSSINTISINPGTASGDLITWDGANWVNMQPAQHFTITVDNRQPTLTINYCIALQGVFPSRNTAVNPFLGEIDMFSFGFAPKGFAQCNGQLLPINQDQALFALLGTQYGGNGTTTFALPNLQGRVPLSMGSNGTSNYVIGQTGGVESNTITH
jgi:microcystin-dependent protein